MFIEDFEHTQTTKITSEHIYQQVATCKQNSFKKQEKSKIQIDFLLNLKKNIANKDLDNNNDSVKKIISIFKKQFNRDEYSSKILIACLNMICMLISKQTGKTRTTSIKYALSPRFIGLFLQIDVKSLTNLNPNIQSSICFILQLIYQNSFFLNGLNENLLKKYKKFTCEFLSTTSNNPKVIFNTLKIIQWMQTKNILTIEQYSRYSIISNIKQLSKQLQIDHILMYKLIFKILINANCIQDAYVLYKQLNALSKFYVVQAFFFILKQHMYELPQKTIVQISRQHLFSKNIASPSFFDFLRQGLSKISFTQFLDLVQKRFVQVSISKWRTAISYNCMPNFLNFLNAIKNKSDHTILHCAVQDIFRMMFPQISDYIQKIRRQRINQIH